MLLTACSTSAIDKAIKAEAAKHEYLIDEEGPEAFIEKMEEVLYGKPQSNSDASTSEIK